MRVLYGYMPNNEGAVALIYQKEQQVGEPVTMQHHIIVGEREATLLERYEIAEKMQQNNRVYVFSSTEELVDSELRFLVFTPQQVQNNLSIYEKSCKR